MNLLTQIQASLPSPYTIEADSVLQRFMDVIALDLEAFNEDMDRMRQTHWIPTVYRLTDAAKLGALLDIPPFAWEHLDLYRERLLALVVVRLKGALGSNEIREFVYTYLLQAERVLGATFLPGLQNASLSEAYTPPATRPLFRPLALEENPHLLRTSTVLADRNWKVPYLFRWSESNNGLDDTTVELTISGLQHYRTVTPVLVNLTTGSLLCFAGRIPFGQTLKITRVNPNAALSDRAVKATMDGNDVSRLLFSVEGFELGIPFSRQQQVEPLVPELKRGVNDWIFLSVGLFDVRGLDRFFFSIASQQLREAVFDETTFDNALLPSGPIAQLEMSWTETEPAGFEVRVPRYLVIEPSSLASSEPLHDEVALALETSMDGLRAAGVRAVVRFVPFEEVQRQSVLVRLPWIVLDPERGPSGETRSVELGGRFGDTSLDQSRFE